MKSRRPLLAYGLALLVVALDQLSKYWVTVIFDLPNKHTVAVLPFFDLTYVPNPGVSFGLFQADNGQEWIKWALVGFSAVVVAILAIWVKGARRNWSAVSIGLGAGLEIASGGMGSPTSCGVDSSCKYSGVTPRDLAAKATFLALHADFEDSLRLRCL